MRYPPEHKLESRDRIVDAAARQIRAKGPDGIVIADVMAAAGLTHGGFYAHFNSKDALIADAVSAMFADAKRSADDLDQALADADADVRVPLRAYLENYLSPAHREGVDRGCPLPSLATEMSRTDSPARENFVEGLQRMTQRIESALARLGYDRPEASAKAAVAEMVGALGLSRAIGNTIPSDQFLRDCLDDLVTRLRL